MGPDSNKWGLTLIILTSLFTYIRENWGLTPFLGSDPNYPVYYRRQPAMQPL